VRDAARFVADFAPIHPQAELHARDALPHGDVQFEGGVARVAPIADGARPAEGVDVRAGLHALEDAAIEQVRLFEEVADDPGRHPVVGFENVLEYARCLAFGNPLAVRPLVVQAGQPARRGIERDFEVFVFQRVIRRFDHPPRAALSGPGIAQGCWQQAEFRRPVGDAHGAIAERGQFHGKGDGEVVVCPILALVEHLHTLRREAVSGDDEVLRIELRVPQLDLDDLGARGGKRVEDKERPVA